MAYYDLQRKGGLQISKMFRRHILILIFRILLLAAAVYFYIADSEKQDFTAMQRRGLNGIFLYVVWAVLVISMLFRLIPNKRTAIGARKHYAQSHQAAPAIQNDPISTIIKRNRLHRGALASALAWIVLNAAVFIVLFLNDMLTPSAAVTLMLIYAVCDMICILFFCPFQVFFLRNRCCTQCRIHNWDYLMMCTPMILFPSFYSISLLLLSASVVLRWELAIHKNPHFFMAETNENLRCDRCNDRLCLVNKPLE